MKSSLILTMPIGLSLKMITILLVKNRLVVHLDVTYSPFLSSHLIGSARNSVLILGCSCVRWSEWVFFLPEEEVPQVDFVEYKRARDSTSLTFPFIPPGEKNDVGVI